MGNRAVITDKSKEIGVYLHWNGGRDSVEAFLKYCELRGFRTVETDRPYAYARLVQIIANFFHGASSVGVDLCKNLDMDNYDNGVYIIEGWKIVGREYFDGREQGAHSLKDMLKAIDDAQPVQDRLGEVRRQSL